MSRSDANEWCLRQGANLGSDGFPKAGRTAQSFEIPGDSGRRVALVASQLRTFSGFAESLVWFHDWAVWPSGQRMHIFERFRASYGEERPLIEVPAFLFSSQEREDLISFVTLGVLFLWDVYVVSSKAQAVIFYSHDEVGWIAE